MFTAARRPVAPWIGICRFIALAMIPQLLTAPLDAQAALNKSGRWISGPDLEFSGTHVAVLRMPGTDTTSVFMFGESGSPQTMKFWRFAPGDTNLRWPTLANTRELPHPNDLKSDLFCSGHATLPDGRMLMVGGTWLPDTICQHVYALDPGWQPTQQDTTPWEQSAMMAVERWYATATPMADGRILASAGTMASVTVGFGGLTRIASGDTTYGRVHPLEQGGRYTWSDTTTIPSNAVTDPRVHYDTYTDGKWPRGREGHGFVADAGGRGIMMFGRSVGPVSGSQVLDDVWSLRGCKAEVDTNRAWDRFEPVGDSMMFAGQELPKPRYHFAMTWAGVESRAEGMRPLAADSQTCYIHGGLDAAGNVLGDLWRGVRRQKLGQASYQWVWKRVLAHDASRARFGHTMMFDPGTWTVGAPKSQLVIYGGVTALSPDTTFADPTKLYVVGVGSSSPYLNTWTALTPAADPSYGYPAAVEGHAMTAIFRGNHVPNRQFFMFGGQDGAGNLVDPDLWYLERPDTLDSQLDDYAWKMIPSGAGGPSARTRAAMSYNVDASQVTVVGGDTNGSAQADGFTNEVWVHSVTSYGGAWRKPPLRDFHAPPPGVAGMRFLSSPEGDGRITRSLELFNGSDSSGAGLGCPALPGQWQTLTLQDDADSERPIADYPFMFQLPDGRLFNAGPAPHSDVTPPYRRFFDLSSKHWTDVNDSRSDPYLFGSAVMYRPGKLLRAVGFTGLSDESPVNGRTETVAISPNGTETWTLYDPAPEKYKLEARRHHNLTLLPTGDILSTGGHGDGGLDESVQEPRLWAVSAARWNSTDPFDNEQLELDPRKRNYHSTAVLLPDARVMTAGGEGHAGQNPDQTTTSVYEPAYLFHSNGDYAVRPRVEEAPAVLTFGRTFTITLTNDARAAHIKSVALMRPGAVTHGFDQNQRYVPMSFTVASNPTRLLVQAPADAYIAQPGDQMLFVIDSLAADAPRVPSIARWTRTELGSLGLDSADVVRPAIVGDLEGCPHGDQNSGELSWTEPADDGTLAASGSAISYDLRYKVSSSNPDTLYWASGWTTASLSSPVTPGTPGGVVTAQVVGLSPNTKYWFRLRTLDDKNQWSYLSNAALIWTQEGWECEGGSFAGGGGGGGDFSAGRIAGPHALRGPSTGVTFENSLLDAGPTGSVRTDALRLPTSLSSGSQRLWFRTHAGIGTAVDRARLLIVEHAAEHEAVVAGGGTVIVGGTTPIVSAQLRSGATLDASLRTPDGQPPLFVPGDTLDLDLGESPGSVLVAEGRSVGGRGPGEAFGFEVLVAGAGGEWTAAGQASLRHRSDRVAVAGLSGQRVRLVFIGGSELTGLWSLTPAQSSPTPTTVIPTLARNASAGEVTSLLLDRDDHSAWLVELDSLHLEFDVPARAEGSIASVFLELTGQTVSPRQAQANRGQVEGKGLGTAPVAFALRQPRPNPSTRGTTLEFSLPQAGVARLEIFDTQGRRVRDFLARYEAGTHRIEWDLRSSRGRRVAPGVYSCRLSAGSREMHQKAVVLP